MDTTIKICNATGISADWLLFGIKPKYRNKRAIHELPEHSLYIITTPEQKAHWDALEDPRNFSVVPIVSEIAAGPVRMVDEKDVDGYAVIYDDWQTPGNRACFRVKGSSMEPVFSSGDIVGVNLDRRDPTELQNAIVAAYFDEGITIKQFRMEEDRVILLPYNIREFSPTVHDLAELDTLIVGAVEWAWKRFAR